MDDGEREAIALVEETGADALLVDEHRARRVALARGISITGTLGIIKLAAAQGMIDAPQALAALRQTSFFVDEAVVAKMFGLPRPPAES